MDTNPLKSISSSLYSIIFLITISIGTTSLAASRSLASDNKYSSHENFIRLSYEFARNAAKKGNHPYAALLVYEGKVILTAENTVRTENDFSRHAEMNLMVEANRIFFKDILNKCTIYSSTYPCISCSQAILFRGISRIVYGVSLESFAKIFGYNKVGLTCEMLYKSLDIPLELIGPILEKEGMEVLKQWPKNDNMYKRVKEHFKKSNHLN